jgi:curved DNA-binding protein CbpA
MRLFKLGWTSMIVLALIMNSCKQNNVKEINSQEKEVAIIRKCLLHMGKNGSKQKYLISPWYDSFDFNAIFRENKVKMYDGYHHELKKPETLNSLNWSKQDFNEIQMRINNEFSGKNNLLFSSLSNADISHSVISFSGIHDNLVFGTIIDYCNKIKKAELNSPRFDKYQKFTSIGTLIFILEKGEVVNMIIDNGITLEYQCVDVINI